MGSALPAFADHSATPDKDLLSVAYAAKKDVSSSEHPALLAFKNRAEYLAPEPGGVARLAEGIAGARYELQEGRVLVRSTDASYDFLDGSTRIDVKGPALANVEGTFLSPEVQMYVDWAIINSATRSVTKVSQGLFDLVVVDVFGLTRAQADNVVLNLQAHIQSGVVKVIGY